LGIFSSANGHSCSPCSDLASCKVSTFFDLGNMLKLNFEICVDFEYWKNSKPRRPIGQRPIFSFKRATWYPVPRDRLLSVTPMMVALLLVWHPAPVAAGRRRPHGPGAFMLHVAMQRRVPPFLFLCTQATIALLCSPPSTKIHCRRPSLGKGLPSSPLRVAPVFAPSRWLTMLGNCFLHAIIFLRMCHRRMPPSVHH
jgi:hypothetical protein